MWRRWTISLTLPAAWAVLIGVQYHEYTHERESAQAGLVREAKTIHNAVLGGIRSHRRMGRFLSEQLQAALDELVQSEGLLAAAIYASGEKPLLAAGRTELLAERRAAGEHWEPDGFRWIAEFSLPTDSDSPPGAGMGPGGSGLGWGRGRRLMAETPGPLAAGGAFCIGLALDRQNVDRQCLRAAQLRGVVAATGGLVLLCLAWIWRTTVRLAEARGRAQMLELETRHLRELGQAASGLAHETRNPLGLIRGWGQRLLESHLPSPQQREQAAAMVEECDRVTARINQFLAFARPRRPSLESVRVADLVEELAALMQPDLEAKQLRIIRNAELNSLWAQADRELLRQALFNLLGNAAAFSPPGGTIDVTLRRDDDGGLRLEVADRGPGVAAQAIESLFTPYFTTRPDGTGLGLAIVHQIAMAHGWRAGYSPRDGGGAAFWLDGIHD